MTTVVGSCIDLKVHERCPNKKNDRYFRGWVCMLSQAWYLLISKIDHGVDPTLLQEINKEINYPHRPHALHSYLILLENTPSAQVRERLRHWFFNRYYQISFSTGTTKSRPLGSV
jgi:hypothetical protein